MMLGWRTVAIAVGASFGAPLMAQGDTPLPQQIEGEIAQADSADPQGRRYDDYPIDLGRGEAIVIIATPATGSRLEPTIEVYAGETARLLARDDADLGSRSARLSFTASEAGVFRIRIFGASAAAGRYTLHWRRADHPRHPR